MNKVEMERRIFELEGQIIDLKRFYLAFRIAKCKNCKNVVVANWESPIFFKCFPDIFSKATVCKKHQKELDEFNRQHASD